MDHEKIESIREWSAPKNVAEVISFMGPAGYYRRFIEGFSKIAHPITSLQKKGVKFQWTLDCEEFPTLETIINKFSNNKDCRPK